MAPASENIWETSSSSCYVANELLRESRKRIQSGDWLGLQNRRAASSMPPVCSTHTRFRQLFAMGYVDLDNVAN